MLTTKKMMEDIKKQNPRDIFVCKKCGSEQLEEQVWVDMNSTIVVDDVVYQTVLDSSGDLFHCRRCNEECSPITFEEYMEENDA